MFGHLFLGCHLAAAVNSITKKTTYLTFLFLNALDNIDNPSY
jgi:hypothetical protein